MTGQWQAQYCAGLAPAISTAVGLRVQQRGDVLRRELHLTPLAFKFFPSSLPKSSLYLGGSFPYLENYSLAYEKLYRYFLSKCLFFFWVRDGVSLLPKMECSGYSQAQSYYISTEFWPVPVPTWASSILLREPGGPLWEVTILMLTPNGHSAPQSQTPGLKRSSHLAGTTGE